MPVGVTTKLSIGRQWTWHDLYWKQIFGTALCWRMQQSSWLTFMQEAGVPGNTDFKAKRNPNPIWSINSAQSELRSRPLSPRIRMEIENRWLQHFKKSTNTMYFNAKKYLNKSSVLISKSALWKLSMWNWVRSLFEWN